MLSKTESSAIRKIIDNAREDGQVTDLQYELAHQALERNTAPTMTSEDAAKLLPGLYRVWFAGGSYSDCAVGKSADGVTTWCAPVDWYLSGAVIESFSWSTVKHIEPLVTRLKDA